MIPSGTKVYFAVQPCDLRRSFDGLAALAASQLERDPCQGGMYVFLNRRGSQVRVLFRDPQGWCILAKRLDRGKFRRPACEAGQIVWETEAPELLRFLSEIDWTRATRRVQRSVHAQLSLVRGSMQ